MSGMSNRRQRMIEKQNQMQRRSRIIWGSIAVVGLGLIATVVWNNLRPPVGQEFPIMESNHISEEISIDEYNSNPPTSGPHFSAGLNAGFYEESDLANLGDFPIGNLVHNLEHGYIIFWYNCELLGPEQCASLKAEIETFMSRSVVRKLIAFPWNQMDRPLVLTSWGYMLDMPTFDAAGARDFINSNRLNAPEPNAP